MSKTKILLQTEHGCKYLVNPDEKEYVDQVHLVNPDLAKFTAHSPEELNIVGGKVVSYRPHCVTKSDRMPYQDLINIVNVLQEEVKNLSSRPPETVQINNPPPIIKQICSCIQYKLPKIFIVLIYLNLFITFLLSLLHYYK